MELAAKARQIKEKLVKQHQDKRNFFTSLIQTATAPILYPLHGIAALLTDD